jgi:hypothetical protein
VCQQHTVLVVAGTVAGGLELQILEKVLALEVVVEQVDLV